MSDFQNTTQTSSVSNPASNINLFGPSNQQPFNSFNNMSFPKKGTHFDRLENIRQPKPDNLDIYKWNIESEETQQLVNDPNATVGSIAATLYQSHNNCIDSLEEFYNTKIANLVASYDKQLKKNAKLIQSTLDQNQSGTKQQADEIKRLNSQLTDLKTQNTRLNQSIASLKADNVPVHVPVHGPKQNLISGNNVKFSTITKTKCTDEFGRKVETSIESRQEGAKSDLTVLTPFEQMKLLSKGYDNKPKMIGGNFKYDSMQDKPRIIEELSSVPMYGVTTVQPVPKLYNDNDSQPKLAATVKQWQHEHPTVQQMDDYKIDRMNGDKLKALLDRYQQGQLY